MHEKRTDSDKRQAFNGYRGFKKKIESETKAKVQKCETCLAEKIYRSLLRYNKYSDLIDIEDWGRGFASRNKRISVFILIQLISDA